MSLGEFQRAFADLAASPEQCLAARRDLVGWSTTYDLTERERRRLAAMVHDESMSVNCTLYRVNRLTPIYSVLPLTCSFLGDRLLPELLSFWDSITDATLQYRREAWRLAHWLLDRIAAGKLAGGPIEDAIRFELAAFDARTGEHIAAPPDAFPHPRKRLVRFSYNPQEVLDPDSTLEWIPLDEPRHVLLDATGDTLVVRVV